MKLIIEIKETIIPGDTTKSNVVVRCEGEGTPTAREKLIADYIADKTHEAADTALEAMAKAMAMTEVAYQEARASRGAKRMYRQAVAKAKRNEAARKEKAKKAKS